MAAPPPSRKQDVSETGSRWRVQAHDGQQYGPVEKQELDAWVSEGLITPACLLQEGNSDWRPASSVYPQLQQTASSPEEHERPGPVIISPFTPVSSAKAIDRYAKHFQREARDHPERVRTGMKKFFVIFGIVLGFILLFGLGMVVYAIFFVAKMFESF